MSAPIYRGGRPFIKPGIRTGNNTGLFNIAGAPTDGTSGTLHGVAGPGSILMRTNGSVYVNTNTKASPTWVSLGVGATNAALTTPAITGGTIAGAALSDSTVTKGSVTPTVTGLITAAMSGKNIFLAQAAGFALTLPAPAAGLNYRFITATTFITTNYTIVTNAGANILFGGAIVNSVFVQSAAQDTINVVATAETVGDYFDLECDGTNWFVSGLAFAAGGFTFTAT